MSYQIHLGKSKVAAVEIHLDGRNPTRIPTSIALGTGKKKDRYKKHLSECFEKNPDLLRYLAFIHKTGKEKGSITLVCNCTSKERYHAESVKEFLTENAETLDMMLPYLFNDAGFKASDVKLDDTASSQPNNANLLTEDDRRQIAELIRQDKEKTAYPRGQTPAIQIVDDLPFIPVNSTPVEN